MLFNCGFVFCSFLLFVFFYKNRFHSNTDSIKWGFGGIWVFKCSGLKFPAAKIIHRLKPPQTKHTLYFFKIQNTPSEFPPHTKAPITSFLNPIYLCSRQPFTRACSRPTRALETRLDSFHWFQVGHSDYCSSHSNDAPLFFFFSSTCFLARLGKRTGGFPVRPCRR